MNLIGIILLVLVGILLIVLEFLVIPGTTIAGIGGVLCLAGGVVMAYSAYGATIGHITLLVTGVAVVYAIFYSLKSDTWKKASLFAKIDGKSGVNVNEEQVSAGDVGKSISRLAPVGTVLINGQFYEARTENIFIDPETELIVEKIDENNKIVVKPKI